MKRYTADYAREMLESVSEANFQSWRHHPVTKVYLRFLRDYEQQLKDAQVGKLRQSSTTPDPFALGTFTGAINAVNEMADPKYESIVRFYAPDETAEEDT